MLGGTVQWEHDLAENVKARNVMMASLESMPEPLGERDFDRILLAKPKLIESSGKSAAKPR
jgi:hypothetical protein